MRCTFAELWLKPVADCTRWELAVYVAQLEILRAEAVARCLREPLAVGRRLSEVQHAIVARDGEATWAE
jgi:hypothetical protein